MSKGGYSATCPQSTPLSSATLVLTWHLLLLLLLMLMLLLLLLLLQD
jgi:hypothetical protein